MRTSNMKAGTMILVSSGEKRLQHMKTFRQKKRWKKKDLKKDKKI